MLLSVDWASSKNHKYLIAAAPISVRNVAFNLTNLVVICLCYNPDLLPITITCQTVKMHLSSIDFVDSNTPAAA